MNQNTPQSKSPLRWRNSLSGLRSGRRFLRYVFQRFVADRCTERAAALTYTSLLAMVPLIAISFAIFAAFPAFQETRGALQSFVFENFVPGIGTAVSGHIDRFTQKTGQLTAVGVVFLGVTAVMLLSSINGTFNAIWRVQESRRLVGRLLVYWAVLTLSPMFFGASLSLSSYLFAAAQASGVEQITGPLTQLAGYLPLVLQILGFSILFLVMPYFPVRRRDALMGGIAAGLLFELLKKGFGLYIKSFPTYETLYGALAAIPILLVWMYLAWIVVLLGAEMTAAMPEWRAGMRRVRQENMPAARLLAAALAILNALLVVSRTGKGLNVRQLVRAAPAAPDAVTIAQERLQQAHYITKDENGDWLVSRDLDLATLSDLKRDLELDLDITDLRYLPKTGWGRRYGHIIADLNTANAEITGMTLKSLLAPDSEAELEALQELTEDEEDNDDAPITDRKTKLLAMFGLAVAGKST